jgi:hypothetical protein
VPSPSANDHRPQTTDKFPVFLEREDLSVVNGRWSFAEGEGPLNKISANVIEPRLIGLLGN